MGCAVRATVGDREGSALGLWRVGLNVGCSLGSGEGSRVEAMLKGTFVTPTPSQVGQSAIDSSCAIFQRSATTVASRKPESGAEVDLDAATHIETTPDFPAVMSNLAIFTFCKSLVIPARIQLVIDGDEKGPRNACAFNCPVDPTPMPPRMDPSGNR